MDLVAVIFMWNSFQALEGKLEGAEKWRAGGNLGGTFRSCRRFVGSFFSGFGSGAQSGNSLGGGEVEK